MSADRAGPVGCGSAALGRFLVLPALAFASAVAVLFLPRIPQDVDYHDFADRRPRLGIPNFQDTVSNLPFLAIGAAGIRRARRLAKSGGDRRASLSLPAGVAFIGVFLTGFGSAYYHLEPTTATLFWDRLPMTILFMGLMAWILAECVAPAIGRGALPVLLFAGVASLVWWQVTEADGEGDLRWYGLVQYFPCLAIPLCLLLDPGRGSRPGGLAGALVFYGLAKACEVSDAAIFDLGAGVSGHTLKHLLAAAAAACLLRHLRGPAGPPVAFRREVTLKSDLLGTVEKGLLERPGEAPVEAVRRDHGRARWWTRPLAAVLARREARALRRLHGVPGVPALLHEERGALIRSWIAGRPLHEARAQDAEFYTAARKLLGGVHRARVTHNDTHKEPNWLVTPDGRPALVDFQLAAVHRRRGRWFRLCATEDLRHLLKHKRTHCPGGLRASERALLARRSWVAAAWRRIAKPPYRWITRGVLGWRDREGRG